MRTHLALLCLAAGCSGTGSPVDESPRAGYPAVLSNGTRTYVAYVLSNVDRFMTKFYGEKVSASGDGESFGAPVVASVQGAPPQPFDCTTPFLFADDGSLLLGLATNTPIMLRSSDGGATWTPTGVKRLYSTFLAMATAGSRVYVLDQLGLDVTIQTYDFTTATWAPDRPLPSGFVVGTCPSLWAAGDDLVLAGGSGSGPVAHSPDRGATWDSVTSAGGAVISRLVSAGNALYLASPGHLYRSADRGRSWAASGDLPARDVDKIQLAAAGPILYVAYQTEPDEVVWVTHSSDSGATFSTAHHIITAAGSWDLGAAATSGGSLVVVAHGTHGVTAESSVDDGETWR